MNTNKLQTILLYIILIGYALTGCDNKETDFQLPGEIDKEEEEKEEEEQNTTRETSYANMFAKDMLETFYYWNEEIKEDLEKLNPLTNSDPIATVKEIRYHEGEKEVDKWTMLTDNIEEFTSEVQGVTTTYGYTPIVYYLSENTNELIAAVAYVSADSPAQKAGLERGDIIYEIDGKTLTTENYENLYYTSEITLSIGRFNENNLIIPKEKVSLTATEMYENPILCHKIFNIGEKKVGYLAYTSFDLKSIEELVEICTEFKTQGVKELILDLRYNGGGYVITECALASMLAPQEAVTEKKIFEKEDYNSIMTEAFKMEGISTVTNFETEYVYEDLGINTSTKNANIGLEKIYGIITKNSASASEALLGGLMPYMDVELIGEQSHGKYCTGWMLAAKDEYIKVPEPIEDWGIYLMASIYKNANDETPCMPDGLIPDVTVEDNPFEAINLGDENETMLKTALTRAGKIYTASRSGKKELYMERVQDTPQKASFGKRIILPAKLHISDIESRISLE